MNVIDTLENEGEGEILLGAGVKMGKDVTINVSERLEIGPRSVIGDYAIIEGRDIKLGTEFWSDRYIQIGGGSCFEPESSLWIGDWGHMGRSSFINTAYPVAIGHEVGLGTGTKLYTHGAYLSLLEGFPVDFAPISIGSNVWIPGATILPGVTIGAYTVIGVGSVVNKSLPGGCLAAGVPARVIHENVYPKPIDPFNARIFLKGLIQRIDPAGKYETTHETIYLPVQGTLFHMKNKTISGPADKMTERLKNVLRRHGIRFKAYALEGEYVPW